MGRFAQMRKRGSRSVLPNTAAGFPMVFECPRWTLFQGAPGADLTVGWSAVPPTANELGLQLRIDGGPWPGPVFFPLGDLVEDLGPYAPGQFVEGRMAWFSDDELVQLSDWSCILGVLIM